MTAAKPPASATTSPAFSGRPLDADALFEKEFSGFRTQRSPVYKAAVLAHLRYRMKETNDCVCPYTAGSVEFDAWWAGVAESWQILTRHDVDRRKPAPKP